MNRNFRRASVLVVEDNADHWVMIQAALQSVLPEVRPVWVADADQARAYLNKCMQTDRSCPQLMLLDLYLPDAEPTWQLLRSIRQPDSPFIRMPIVVFSGSSNRDDISEIYTFGGTSYITKPMDFQKWFQYFEAMRQYWWETVTLPGN